MKRLTTLFCGEHFKGLSNQADVELDMINVISAADITFIMSSSRPIRFFIVFLMYNNTKWQDVIDKKIAYHGSLSKHDVEDSGKPFKM